MRRANDAYYTPTDAVNILVARRPVIGQGAAALKNGDVVCEPCVGGGAIANVFRERGCRVVTNDLVPSIEAEWHDDAQAFQTWRELSDPKGPIDWTVTNPPFVAAMAILKQAYEHSHKGVAMFLRLSFLEPTEDRGAWLQEHPPDELIVLPRISFTGDGSTDSVTCAWMIWYKNSYADNDRAAIEVIAKPEDADEAQQNLWAV